MLAKSKEIEENLNYVILLHFCTYFILLCKGFNVSWSTMNEGFLIVLFVNILFESALVI